MRLLTGFDAHCGQCRIDTDGQRWCECGKTDREKTADRIERMAILTPDDVRYGGVSRAPMPFWENKVSAE